MSFVLQVRLMQTFRLFLTLIHTHLSDSHLLFFSAWVSEYVHMPEDISVLIMHGRSALVTASVSVVFFLGQ